MARVRSPVRRVSSVAGTIKSHPSSSSSGKRADSVPDGEAETAGARNVAPLGRQDTDTRSEIQYETMSWLQATYVIIAETVSLGILSLAFAVSRMGLIPGLILLNVIAVISWASGYIVWRFVMRFPHVHSYADALALMFGRPGRWIGETIQTLLLVFLMAAHIVVFSNAMDTLTDKGICSIYWKPIGMVVCYVFTIPRELKKTSYVSIASCISICAATIVAMVGIATSQSEVGRTYGVTPASLTSWAAVGRALSCMILSFTGQIAYPSIIGEMKSKQDFPKALALGMTVTTTMYNVVAVVIYKYAGQEVAELALESAPLKDRKIAYGIAQPTIIVAGVIASLVVSKDLYKQYWHSKKMPEMTKSKSCKARMVWYGINAALWALACFIALAIPSFGKLLSLLGAMFATWFCCGFPAMFWFYLDWEVTVKQILATDITPTTVPGDNMPLRQAESEKSPPNQEASIHGVLYFNGIPNNEKASGDPCIRGPPRANLTIKQRMVKNARMKPVWALVVSLIFVVGFVCCGLGMYGSLHGLIYENKDGQRPFSCN